MLGGHADIAGRRSDTYNTHVVYSLRSDYQSVGSQQSGYLRIMRFSPADDTIYVTTYSPTQDIFYPDATDNNFDLAYDMEGAADFQLIGSPVTHVASGENASVIWSGLSNDTEYEWYAVVNDGQDTATSDTWSFTTESAPANNAPVIAESDPQTVDMSEDGLPTAFILTLHATDPDVSDTLTWSISSGATHGTARTSGTGTSKIIDYTPDADYNGTDSFVVQVSDGNGGTDTLTVNVNIAAVNDARR